MNLTYEFMLCTLHVQSVQEVSFLPPIVSLFQYHILEHSEELVSHHQSPTNNYLFVH